MRKFLLTTTYYYLRLLFCSTLGFSSLIADIDIVDFSITLERKHVTLMEGGNQHPYDKQNKQRKYILNHTRQVKLLS